MVARKVTSKEERAHALGKIFTERLQERGYDSVRQFVRSIKLPYSEETARRALGGDTYKTLEPTTVAIIAKHLDYTPDEVRELLQTYTDDRSLWPMIGKGSDKLNITQEAILAATDAMTEGNPECLKLLADQLDLLSRLCGVDIGRHTAVLRRKQNSPKEGQ